MFFLKSRKGLVSLTTIAFALSSFYAQKAEACGGFFCSQAQPVVQQGEQIIFVSDEEAQQYDIIVGIQYTGPAEEFSWLLPIEGIPEIGVSSQLGMDRLVAATSPQFILDYQQEGTCKEPDWDDFATAESATVMEDGVDGGVVTQANDVTILDEGSVGPYDFVIIEVNPLLPDRAEVAVDWLNDNEYDVDDDQAALIRPYLNDDMNLVAVRLSKNQPAGAIQPLHLSLEQPCPSIPIRLTAVATADNMGVMSFFSTNSRSVPTNYRSLELNEARINWLDGGQNYLDVVNQAADEAGGQGFVTEYAKPNSELEGFISSPNDRLELDNYRNSYDEGNGWSLNGLIQTLAAQYNGQELGFALEAAGASSEVMEMFRAGDQETSFEGETIDVDVLFTELTERVIVPLEEMDALVRSQPYMTRLFTTLSADEMTLDPMFAETTELGDYDNIHRADIIVECREDVYYEEAPWRIELPQGGLVRGIGQPWSGGGFPEADESMPFNASVSQFDASGASVPVEDNHEEIEDRLEEQNEQFVTNHSSGCSNHEGKLSFGLLALCLVLTRQRRTLTE